MQNSQLGQGIQAVLKTSAQLYVWCCHLKQRAIDRDAATAVCKSLLPLHMTEMPFVVRLLLYCDPWCVFATRNKLVNKVIAWLSDKATTLLKVFVSRSISVSILFDLWITHASQDVLSIMCWAVDSTSVDRHFHLSLVRVESTSGDALSKIRSKNLTRSEVEKKMTSSISDCRSNMAKAGSHLKGFLSCPSFGFKAPLKTRQWSHTWNIAMAMPLGLMPSMMQPCLRYLFQVGEGTLSGPHILGQKEGLQFTFVNGKLLMQLDESKGSLQAHYAVLLQRGTHARLLVESRAAVTYLYGNVNYLTLQKRNLSAEEWFVV